MDTYPLVSVIIVTYQQEHIVRETIDSVLKQTYKNIEIIIGDDGSKDKTQDILCEYQNRYPHLIKTVLSPVNRGISSNVNRLIPLSMGKYIAWLGGDDIMLPEKICTQVDYMEKNPYCHLCYHDLDVFSDSDGTTLFYFNSKYKPREGTISTLIRYGCFCGACSVMSIGSIARKKRINEKITVASDWFFWIECLDEGGEIHFIDKVLGRYRKSTNSVTINKKFKVAFDHLLSIFLITKRYPKCFFDILYRLTTGTKNFLTNA